jgi:phosphatidylinositol alpha-mannosyltransferase
MHLKIGIATEYYYPLLGGISEHVHNTALMLRQKGHIVKIITSGLDGGRAGKNGLPPEETNAGRSDNDILRIGRSTAILSNGSIARVTIGRHLIREMRDLLEREQFDLLHLHSPLVPTVPMVALHAAKCPTVGTFHTYFDKSLWSVWYSLLTGRVQRLVDKLDGQIAVSRSCVDALTPFFKINARIIPNGVNISEFSPDIPKLARFEDGKKNLLFLGRLDPRNGFSLMIRAFELVKEQIPDVRLIIVGDGPLRRYYKRIVPTDIQESIHLVGPILEERNRYYASCDVFCSPVEKASFGVTLLEAMATGKPVVATDNCGYRELFGKDEGFLVPPRDPQAFSAAILHLLKNPTLGEEMGTNGRQKALGFSWDKVTDLIAGFYKEILYDR